MATSDAKRSTVLESPWFVKGGDAPIETAGPGIRRQLLGFGDTIMAARVWFEEGAVGDTHAHSHAQVTYVESGVFKVHIAERETTLAAGDSFYVPPNADHGAVCLTSGVLIDVFSPARKDFLTPVGDAE